MDGCWGQNVVTEFPCTLLCILKFFLIKATKENDVSLSRNLKKKKENSSSSYAYEAGHPQNLFSSDKLNSRKSEIMEKCL